MPDAALIQRVLDGDQEAYADLVRAHQARIRRLCAHLLGDAMLADDAAQEVFFKAYQQLASFRQQSSFSTWLYRIASNQCLDLLRRRRRERTESWDALVEQQGEQVHEHLAVSPEAAPTPAYADLAHRALARLSPDDRLVLTLRELEGLSYEEIAQALQCSLDAVKSRLRRAREKLSNAARHFLPPGGV